MFRTHPLEVPARLSPLRARVWAWDGRSEDIQEATRWLFAVLALVSIVLSLPGAYRGSRWGEATCYLGQLGGSGAVLGRGVPAAQRTVGDGRGGRRGCVSLDTAARRAAAPATREDRDVHPRTIGWFGTVALAMGGSNQSLFLISGLMLSQGSGAVPLLVGGCFLSRQRPAGSSSASWWPKPGRRHRRDVCGGLPAV